LIAEDDKSVQTDPLMLDQPRVSVVLTTRDRPRFLQIALRCFAAQTYPNRELVIVDDGIEFPVNEALAASAGARLVSVNHGASIGAKLNAGIEAASGPLCQKMDDDDWYAPDFLETMLAYRTEALKDVYRPMMTFVMPFLFFELDRWEIRRSIDQNVPGATLMFDRDDWLEQPFRNLERDEDVWYFHDQRRLGRDINPVDRVEIFLAVRHHGVTGDRGHTWTHQHGRQTLEEYLQSRPLHDRQPEDLLPDWALHSYRKMRAGMLLANAVSES